jgi:hypothetical protein
VLFDLPHATAVAQAAGLESERLRVQPGDFFSDTLPSAIRYLIVQVIHDGDDLKAARILAGIRKVAATDAKLLLIECIVPENSKPSWDQDARSADADATVATTRTNASRTLRIRRAAGFRLDRAIDVGLWTSMLKSVAV